MKASKDKVYQEKPVKPSLVPPWLAAVLSWLIPGTGQMLSHAIQRGIIILVSTATMYGLMIWRFQNAAPRDTGIYDIVTKALYLKPILILIMVLFVIFFIWNIVDAYQVAARSRRGERRKPFMVFVMLILVFFFVGWEIGDIDLAEFFTQLDDAFPAISKVLWPWERAITYPEDIMEISATLQSPCTEDPPGPTEPLEDEPYLIVDPTCGIPSAQEDLNGAEETVIGTELFVQGYNFTPDVEVEIWWRTPTGATFRQKQAGEYVRLTPDDDGYFEVTINWPYAILGGSFETGVTEWEIQGRQLVSIGEWEFSEELTMAVEKMIETIFIGMMATFFGIILALPVSFLAARNLMSGNPVTMGIYYLVRGILNIIRSIEPMIWAIIAVIVVGLGPWAGILALTLHSIAALGKLYSEAIESIDPGPIEAIQATGANWFQIVMYAVVPQVIPPFVSFTIYRWDINIRMSTIIGMVGGGGIGYLLQQWMRNLDYRASGIAVWFIAITVAVLDYVSAEIRERFT
jgi:phosphonate transport system permease protein